MSKWFRKFSSKSGIWQITKNDKGITCQLVTMSGLYKSSQTTTLRHVSKSKSVREIKLCTNYLQENRFIINSRASNSGKCGKQHHTLLHFSRNGDTNRTNPQTKAVATTSTDSAVRQRIHERIVTDSYNLPKRIR